MKPGDIVTLRSDRVAVQLLSDAMERRTDIKSTLISSIIDNIAFRRGDIATVIEVNQKNRTRVKIFYKSSMWWGTVSDMVVIGDESCPGTTES